MASADVAARACYGGDRGRPAAGEGLEIAMIKPETVVAISGYELSTGGGVR